MKPHYRVKTIKIKITIFQKKKLFLTAEKLKTGAEPSVKVALRLTVTEMKIPVT